MASIHYRNNKLKRQFVFCHFLLNYPAPLIHYGNFNDQKLLSSILLETFHKAVHFLCPIPLANHVPTHLYLLLNFQETPLNSG